MWIFSIFALTPFVKFKKKESKAQDRGKETVKGKGKIIEGARGDLELKRKALS